MSSSDLCTKGSKSRAGVRVGWICSDKITPVKRTVGSWMVQGKWAKVILAMAAALPVQLLAAPGVFLEDLTTAELQVKVQHGTHVVLVPIGGTEQNGPHMVIGKHNARVRALSALIAQELGNAVVAPVVAYVPEGSVNPPVAHMRFAGTISISESTFESLLESAARSLCSHGLTDVFFLGDHGGYRSSLHRVAQRLQRPIGSGHPCHGFAVDTYYSTSQDGFSRWLKSQGYSEREIGTHAGLADTALSLAVVPTGVRQEALESAGRLGTPAGVYGDPARATAQLGQHGVNMVVAASVDAIRKSLQRTKP